VKSSKRSHMDGGATRPPSQRHNLLSTSPAGFVGGAVNRRSAVVDIETDGWPVRFALNDYVFYAADTVHTDRCGVFPVSQCKGRIKRRSGIAATGVCCDPHVELQSLIVKVAKGGPNVVGIV